MLVSIVVNNYNYQRYVRQAIESALAQTYKPVEVIVVDDGSTDQSPEIIEEYSDRVTVILKENGGQASAFNSGASRARGELIILLDSDDFLLPHAVETCVNKFPPGYSRMFYRLSVVDAEGRVNASPRVAVPFTDFDGNAIAAVAAGGDFPSVPTTGNIFSAKCLKAVLPIPEDEYRICADAFVMIKTALCGPVRSLDQELGAYRVHGNNQYADQAPQLLVDKKRLSKHVENYYKTYSLLEQACTDAGFSYLKQEQAWARRFYPLHILCAAFANSVNSPWLSKVSRQSLTLSVGQYLKVGESSIPKRCMQAIYLTCILWLPNNVAAVLMRVMDKWQRR